MTDEKAFPNPHLTNETGMTLRDYFAAKAMEGICARVQWSSRGIAETAYDIADAMLKARQE